MPFDVAAARKDGVPDSQIADYLASKVNFDLKAARNDNVPDSQIVDYLAPKIGAQPSNIESVGQAGQTVASNIMENLKDAATQTGEAISNPTPGAPVILQRIGQVGNAIQGVGQAAMAPVAGLATAAVEPFLPAASRFVKGLVPNDPRFQALQPGDAVHQVARGIGSDVATAAGLGMAANAGRAAALERAGLPPEPTPMQRFVGNQASGGVDVQPTPQAPASPAVAVPSIEDIKNKAVDFYNSAESKGGLLKEDVVNNVINTANQEAGLQSQEGRTFAGDNAVTKTLADLDKLRDKPISLKGLGEIDDDIGDRIGAAFRAGNNEQATKLMKIRDTLRDASTSAAQSDMVNPNGFADWRTGDQLWTAYRSADDVQKIIENGMRADVPSTAIKNGFKTFIRNEKNLRPFTEAEKTALRQAAKTGLVTAALKSVGSKIITGVAAGGAGFAGGGIPGALVGSAIGQAVGYPMRAAATAIQAGKGQNVINMIGQRPVVQQAFKKGLKP